MGVGGRGGGGGGASGTGPSTVEGAQIGGNNAGPVLLIPAAACNLFRRSHAPCRELATPGTRIEVSKKKMQHDVDRRHVGGGLGKRAQLPSEKSQRGKFSRYVGIKATNTTRYSHWGYLRREISQRLWVGCGATLAASPRRLVVAEKRSGTNRRADGTFVLIRAIARCCMAYGHSSSNSSSSSSSTERLLWLALRGNGTTVARAGLRGLA